MIRRQKSMRVSRQESKRRRLAHGSLGRLNLFVERSPPPSIKNLSRQIAFHVRTVLDDDMAAQRSETA
jgi:hypothetical protein